MGHRLLEFLPDRLFDAHVHVSRESGFAAYTQTLHAGIPGIRDVRALLIPMPEQGMSSEGRDCLNRCVTDQLDRHPGTVGEIFVLPGDSCDRILAMSEHPAVRGLKCYFYSAGKPDPAIGEYLPESAWQAAHQKELAITLHLTRAASLADPENLEYIQRMCRRYPHAKLILAHCGRAFAAWTCQEPVKQLQGIDNLYYDLSAVCEPAPIYYCLKYARCDHILWGSDYPVSRFRGKAISVGSGFAWVDEAAINSCSPTAPVMSVMMENLLAVYTAMDMLELSKADMDRVFFRNAVELFAEGRI